MAIHKIKLDQTFDWEGLGNSMSTAIKFDGSTLFVAWKDKGKSFDAKSGDRFMFNCHGTFPDVTKMKAPKNPVLRAMWENGATKSKRVSTLEELKKIEITYWNSGRGYDARHTYLRITDDGNFAVMMYKPKRAYGYKPYAWWAKDISKIDLKTATHMTNWVFQTAQTDMPTHYYNQAKGDFYIKALLGHKDTFNELMSKVGMSDLTYQDALSLMLGQLRETNYTWFRDMSAKVMYLGSSSIKIDIKDLFGYRVDIGIKESGDFGYDIIQSKKFTKEEVDEMISEETDPAIIDIMSKPTHYIDTRSNYLAIKTEEEVLNTEPFKSLITESKKRLKVLQELGIGIEYSDLYREHLLTFDSKILEDLGVGHRYAI